MNTTHYALSVIEALQPLGHHVILALAGTELHHLDLVRLGVALQPRHEAPAHRRHQRRGGKGLAAVTAKEPSRILPPRANETCATSTVEISGRQGRP